MPSLLSVLSERGLLHDATPSLAERLAGPPITGYAGFDPTADSLHVGNLVPVMALAWLQRLGGRPIVVVGGGTGMVGDPSGKRDERPMLSIEAIDANSAAIRTQLSQFMSFEGERGAVMVNNADWLRPLGLMEFLRDTGKHFTVNYMLQKDAVKSRMESGISFTEFSYMLVQAHDFHHLFSTMGCELQVGGSDQWGNITAGIELIARREQAQAHGLVCPLLTTAAGAKFGKSEDGNVWLDPARTSPYQFYQFWLNTDDRDVGRLLGLFTFLELGEIARVMLQHTADPGQRVAQRLLADDMTSRIHGPDTTRRVIEASRILFGGGDLRSADAGTLAIVAGEVRVLVVTAPQVAAGFPLVEALIGSGLAASKGEARRGLEGHGFSVNGEKITTERPLRMADVIDGRYIVLQKGKRNFALIEVQ